MIRAVVAFDANDDQRGMGVFHIFFQSPGFSVGGMSVKKEVMPVKHVQYREPLVGVKCVCFWQTDVCTSHFVSGEFRNSDIPFFYHKKPPLLIQKLCDHSETYRCVGSELLQFIIAQWQRIGKKEQSVIAKQNRRWYDRKYFVSAEGSV